MSAPSLEKKIARRYNAGAGGRVTVLENERSLHREVRDQPLEGFTEQRCVSGILREMARTAYP